MKARDGKAVGNRRGSVSPDQVRRVRQQADIADWLRELLKAQPTLAQIAAREGLTLRTVRAIVQRTAYAWVSERPSDLELLEHEVGGEPDPVPAAEIKQAHRELLRLRREMIGSYRA